MNDEKFVKTWLRAYQLKTGLRKMCKAYNLDYVQTSLRASQLRRIGVKLPTMPKQHAKSNILTVDVDKLNKIVVDVLGEEALTWRNR